MASMTPPTLPPRTFMLMRLANGWSLRLFRITAMPTQDVGTVPLDDVYVAKDLAEIKALIEDLMRRAGAPEGEPSVDL